MIPLEDERQQESAAPQESAALEDLASEQGIVDLGAELEAALDECISDDLDFLAGSGCIVVHVPTGGLVSDLAGHVGFDSKADFNCLPSTQDWCILDNFIEFNQFCL